MAAQPHSPMLVPLPRSRHALQVIYSILHYVHPLLITVTAYYSHAKITSDLVWQSGLPFQLEWSS